VAVAALAVVAALILPVASASADAGASAKKRGWTTLRASGFKIKAPPGYRLKLYKGAYEITGPAGEMTLLALSTNGSARTVAEALLGGGLPATPNPNHFGLLVSQKGGRTAEVYFTQAPGGVAVTALEPGKGKRRKAGKRARPSGATASAKKLSGSQRRLFARMAGSARNLRPVGLPTSTTQEQEPPIPLKPFTTADGSAKAMVPDAPGWVAGGEKGIIQGYHPEQGSYAFGVLVGAFEPGWCFEFPCQTIEAPFMSVRPALEQVWPFWLNKAGGNVSSIQVTSEIPGSAGLLGSGISSGMFQVSFVANGKPGIGYVIAGTAQFEPGLWYLYYSYIAAYNGVSGTVGDALLRTWQSWDPSADQARRQQETIITQQETTAIIQSANEYRRAVYEKTNYNWSAYIQGNDPVLDPVAPGVIGEGNQTLVQGPDGKLFNFAGNQFKKPGE
jgi:hypothetical protein